MEELIETHEEYRARDGVNWSRLKLARTSALHYRDTPPRKDSASLGMLRAVHALVLENDHFKRDFAVWTSDKPRRGKVYDAFVAANAHRTILNQREFQRASEIARAVIHWPGRVEIVGNEFSWTSWSDWWETEVSLYWTDDATGLSCKGRADMLAVISDEDSKEWAEVADLKTVKSIDPRALAREIASMGYHAQIEHYAAGVEAVRGVPVERVGFLCVEGQPPYDVGFYWLDDEARAAGRALRDRLLRIVADAAETGDYPGQCPEPANISLPAWALDSAHGDTFTSSGS